MPNVMKTSLIVPKVKLTLAEQVELGRRMTLYGDHAAREELILNCIPVVTAAAQGYSKHNRSSYDDLFQEGMMGVMEAIAKYDYTRNTKFSSFAYSRIIKKLVMWVKKQAQLNPQDMMGSSVNSIIIDSTIESFQSLFNSHPTDSQLAELLSVSVEQIAILKKRHANPVPPAFRVCSYEAHDLPVDTFGDDAAEIVERTMCNEYNRKHIFKALETMDELEREIILKRYLYDNRSSKARIETIAQEHGVHCSTVSRRERSALNKILCYFKDNGIQPEF